MTLTKIIKDIFTGRDNETVDVGRVLWMVMCLTFVGLAIVHVVVNKQGFDPASFGAGAGGVLGGGGIALGMKRQAEPD